MSWRPILFCDLDGTLFQTARKMAEPAHEDRIAAFAANGHHSYMTAAQARFVDWAHSATRFIPVTARSTEALRRARIPFRDWQIAANGAVLLRADGTPDPEWLSRIKALSRTYTASLYALSAAVSARNTSGLFRYWIVSEHDMPIYFCVKSNGEESRLDEIWDELCLLAGSEFQHHRNGNNISFTPNAISKAEAVKALLQRLPEAGRVSVLGMGDSITDVPFMRLTDVMLIPPGSQIDDGIGTDLAVHSHQHVQRR